MTWLKLSDDFGDECARAGLSDEAFRLHVEGLGWAMRRENGGRIDRRDLRRFAETADPEFAAAELVAVDFWSATSDGGWQIDHHMEYQPDPQVISARRAKDATRQTRRRRKLVGLDTPDDTSQRESRRDSRVDYTRDPGRVGSGRDGSGTTKDAPTEEPEDFDEEPPDDPDFCDFCGDPAVGLWVGEAVCKLCQSEFFDGRRPGAA